MGWVVEDIVAEDWGWCLLVKCEGFRLCVGCGNVDDYDQSASESLLESEQELTWTCFVEAQGPLFARVFRRQQMTTVAIKLFEAIELILTNERAIYPLPGCSGPRVQ